MEKKSLFIGVLIGLVFVVSILAFSYNSESRITGNALFEKISINYCSGGPDKQGTCSPGQHCSAATKGICRKPTQPVCPTCVVNEKTWTEVTLNYAENTKIILQNGIYKITLKGTTAYSYGNATNVTAVNGSTFVVVGTTPKADIEVSGFGIRDFIVEGNSKNFSGMTNTLNIFLKDVIDQAGTADDRAILTINNSDYTLLAGATLSIFYGHNLYDVTLMGTTSNRADVLVKGSLTLIREVFTQGSAKQVIISPGPKIGIVAEEIRDSDGVANDQARIRYRFY